jgi:hypothetical protein
VSRNKRVQVLLTDQEFLAFQDYAIAQGVSMSECFRQWARQVAPPLPVPRDRTNLT